MRIVIILYKLGMVSLTLTEMNEHMFTFRSVVDVRKHTNALFAGSRIGTTYDLKMLREYLVERRVFTVTRINLLKELINVLSIHCGIIIKTTS